MNEKNELWLSNPLIVGLDVDSAEECLRLVDLLKGRVGAFKVGPRLVVRFGADLVTRLATMAPVFVDNKYFDIPNTMDSAIRATFDAGASLATIHAGAGPEAMALLAKTERELCRIRPFRILAVTVLTSFSQDSLPPTSVSLPIADQVLLLAKSAFESGLSGLVCSPHEVKALRTQSESTFLVTPGVRMPGDLAGDQKRVATPRDALTNGASAFVMARPIVESADPVATVEKVMASLKGVES